MSTSSEVDRATTAPQTSLVAVFNEDVLRLILRHLSSKDLSSICLTDKNSRVLAEPLLYTEIGWDWSGASTPPIVNFLRSILHRPALAQNIRVLSLSGSTREWPTYGDWLPRMSTKALNLDAVIHTMRKTEVPFIDEWEANISSMDALLALLVSQAPMLTQLHLSRSWSEQPRLLCMVIGAGIDGCYDLPSYDRLLEVSHNRYNNRHKKGHKHTKELLSFFYLANIKRLDVALDNPIKLNWPAHSPLCTSLTSLTLESIRENYLYTLLQSTPNIKRLQLTLRYDSLHAPETYRQMLDLDQLMEALNLFQDSLEALIVILIATSEDLVDNEVQIVGSIKALSNFVALKTLRVPLLWLDDFLQDEECNFSRTTPRSLHQLTLVNDLYRQVRWIHEDGKVIKGLEDMLRDRETLFPELTSLAIDLLGASDDWDWTGEAKEHVRSLGRTYGLQISVHHHPE